LAGPLASLHVEGPTDGELFRLFVTEVLVPLLWPGAVVVWDNLSISIRPPGCAKPSRRSGPA